MVDFLSNRLPEDRFVVTHKKKRRIWLWLFVLICGIVLFRGIHSLLDTPETITEVMAYESDITINESPGFFGYVKKFIVDPEKMLRGEIRDNINVLVLGIGGSGHDGPNLSDTILIANVRPSLHTVNLLSIPRDVGVPIDGEIRKINFAHAYGEAQKQGSGSSFVAEILEDMLDIPIHYYVRIDFEAFEKIIDEVGGIDVMVERSFVDNAYPAENSEYQTIEFTRGMEHMDGSRALMFVRSRHGTNGENSDYARSRRQQKILGALKEKLLSYQTILNPARVKRIIDTLGTHVNTDIDLWSGIRLAKIVGTVSTDGIRGAVIDSAPDGLLKEDTTNGVFLLLPTAGDFSAMQSFTHDFFGNEETKDTTSQPAAPAATPTQPITVYVQNGTWEAGLAAQWRALFEDMGLPVVGIGNSAERPLTQTLILLRQNTPEISRRARDIQTRLAVPGQPSLSSALITDDTGTAIPPTDIVIILGEDSIAH